MADVALMVVSHDRYFLDSVVDEIFDLVDGKIERYPTNYSGFTELKAQRQLAQERRYEQQQAFIAKEEEYIRRFGAGQRATQARAARNASTASRPAGATRASSPHRPGPRRPPRGPQSHPQPRSRKTLRHRCHQNRRPRKILPGKPLFEGLTLHVRRGKRVGIIGPNGSGKSTLLNILAGSRRPMTGTSSGATG